MQGTNYYKNLYEREIRTLKTGRLIEGGRSIQGYYNLYAGLTVYAPTTLSVAQACSMK